MSQNEAPENVPENEGKPENNTKKCLVRIAKGGFWFFFIKGLVWIAIFVAGYFGVKAC